MYIWAWNVVDVFLHEKVVLFVGGVRAIVLKAICMVEDQRQ